MATAAPPAPSGGQTPEGKPQVTSAQLQIEKKAALYIEKYALFRRGDNHVLDPEQVIVRHGV